MLKEIGLYGEIDKVERAMVRLRLHEPPEGYDVAAYPGETYAADADRSLLLPSTQRGWRYGAVRSDRGAARGIRQAGGKEAR